MLILFILFLVSGTFCLYLGINGLVSTIATITKAIVDKKDGTLDYSGPLFMTTTGVVLLIFATAFLVAILI